MNTEHIKIIKTPNYT